MDVYIINMDKNKDRFEKITNQLENLKISYYRESATNGKELSNEEIVESTSMLCRNIICNYGIIGCAISHMNIWNKYYNMVDKPEFICVSEDDACFTDIFPVVLNDIPIIYNEIQFDILSLYSDGLGVGKHIKIKDYTVTDQLFPLSTICYILSKKGVQKLIEIMPKKVKGNIDGELAFAKRMGLEYYTLTQPNVVNPSLDESTINNCSGGILNTIIPKSLKKIINVNILTFRLKYSLSIYTILLVLLLTITIYKKYYAIMIIIFLELLLVVNNITI